MHSGARKVWILFKHEYLRRVRTRSFVLATLLLPFIVLLIIGIPALATVSQLGRAPKNVVLACDHDEMVKYIGERLAARARGLYRVTVDTDLSPAQQEKLMSEVNSGRIDGFIWIDDAAIANRTVTYERRTIDPNNETLAAIVSAAINRQSLARRGVSFSEADAILRPVRLQPLSGSSPGREKKARDQFGGYVMGLVFFMVLFFTMMSYGVMVMRAVLDEKASRVFEVLLCSATAYQLMASKIIGIGLVGMTQVVIWGAMARLIGASFGTTTGFAMHVPLAAVTWFAMSYVLGYLLYATMFAGVGAAFNSLDEAQQWNFLILSPLIVSSLVMAPVMNSPDSAFAAAISMVPFFAPLLMYLRILVGHPPIWQIALSLALVVATICAAFHIAARIYRVGILMYGKRPTLGEMIKWLRYA